ncbi:MAG: hypothetical protein CL534_16110 [Ahrensia sp.]|nr:hypothetical protein [Ahrensia sp.]
MNRYVVLCDCGGRAESAWWEPVNGRHVVAVIDDGRPAGALQVEPNYFGGHGGNVGPGGFAFAYSTEPNRLNEHRDPLNLRCPAACLPKLPRIRESTIAVVLDRMSIDSLESIDFHERDEPASAADALKMQQEVEADFSREEYDGERPTLVPVYSTRRVIPWAALVYGVSKMTKDRR